MTDFETDRLADVATPPARRGGAKTGRRLSAVLEALAPRTGSISFKEARADAKAVHALLSEEEEKCIKRELTSAINHVRWSSGGDRRVGRSRRRTRLLNQSTIVAKLLKFMPGNRLMKAIEGRNLSICRRNRSLDGRPCAFTLAARSPNAPICAFAHETKTLRRSLSPEACKRVFEVYLELYLSNALFG